MKRFHTTFTIITLFLFTSFLYSCTDNLKQFENQTTKTDFFFLRGAKHQLLTKIDPILLSMVKDDLKKKNRADAIEKLNRTYDPVTGNIRSASLKFANKTNPSGKKASVIYGLEVTVDDYLSSYGWSYGYGVDPSDNTLIIGQAQIGGKLQAATMHTNPHVYEYGDYVMLNSQHFAYDCYGKNAGWGGLHQPGETMGSIGTDMEAIWFDAGPDALDFMAYRGYFKNTGTSNWVNNGSVLGTTGSNNPIEAVQIFILTYEDEG